MDLTQLKYFKAVAESGSMSEAAQKLNVSQPAVSVAIKKMEEELCVLLFERKKNKLILNDSGKMALTYAQAILQKSDEMKALFCRCRQQDHVLSLGFSDPGPMRFVVPLFQKQVPDIVVSSQMIDDEENDLYSLLISQFDAVISLREIKRTDVDCLAFAREELLVSVPNGHALAKNGELCLSEQKDTEFAVYGGIGAYVRQVMPFLKRLARKNTVTFYDDYFVFRQMLDQKAVATFTTRLVRQYRNDGENRVFVPLTDPELKAVYYMAYLKKNKARLLPLLQWAQEKKLLF